MYKAGGYTFVIIFSFWAIHHTALEIEQPFDGDLNDVPLEQISHKFNKTLQRLLEMKAQEGPRLLARPAVPARKIRRLSTFHTSSDGMPLCLNEACPCAGSQDLPQQLGSCCVRSPISPAAQEATVFATEGGWSAESGGSQMSAQSSRACRRPVAEVTDLLTEGGWSAEGCESQALSAQSPRPCRRPFQAVFATEDSEAQRETSSTRRHRHAVDVEAERARPAVPPAAAHSRASTLEPMRLRLAPPPRCHEAGAAQDLMDPASAELRTPPPALAQAPAEAPETRRRSPVPSAPGAARHAGAREARAPEEHVVAVGWWRPARWC